MNNKVHFPGWMELLEVHLEKNFSGKICVIFCHPLNHMIEVVKHFKISERGLLVNCEYAVLECTEIKQALDICNKTPDCKPFTMVWENTQIVHENS